jgi:hypothetical protein
MHPVAAIATATALRINQLQPFSPRTEVILTSLTFIPRLLFRSLFEREPAPHSTQQNFAPPNSASL